jgi:hypothetical protein
MISTRHEFNIKWEPIHYLDLYGRSAYEGVSGAVFARTAVNGLYVASLYTPVDIKNGTVDLWGGIKIPSLDSSDLNHPDLLHEGDNGTVIMSHPLYTSLLGIPINTTTYKTSSQFTYSLNTTYFTTQCAEPTVHELHDPGMPNRTDDATFVLETQSSTVDGILQRNISLFTYPNRLSKAIVHNCTLTPHFLLAQITCNSRQCDVTRVQRIDDPDTQLSNRVLGSETKWGEIMYSLPRSTGREHSAYSSQTERYLWDPQLSLGTNNVELMDFRQVPIDEFSKRFTVVLNTYYQATISPRLRLNNLVLEVDRYNSVQETVATNRMVSPDTYQRHWPWVISAFLASLAMFIIAITGIILDIRVIGPDVYGYVSSMTRDNPHFPMPPNGCTLGGIDRAVLMKDVVVRFEDVAPDNKIGHLAFTMAGYKKPNEQPIDSRLRRTRMYSGCS